jgi:H+/Cl- antiporter ClcA
VVKHRIQEEAVLLTSVAKWLVLATLTGLVVGLATTGFLALLAWSMKLSNRSDYTYLLLPVAFFLSALVIKYLAPDAEGHGTEKVIEAVHKRAGKIAPLVVPVKLVATIITLAVGGSAGKEGPCAQIGAGLSSLLADLFKFSDQDRKKLVICGISAGFASVFGTPIAGSLFGVEVLFIGGILYDVLLPSFIAGITSYHVSSLLGMTYFQHPVKVTPVFSETVLLQAIAAGVFFGLCSMLLIETLDLGKSLFARLKVWLPLKGLVGGLLLIILSSISSKEYLGLGLESIESCLSGNSPGWYSFLWKSVFTSITLNSGGSGGIVTPIFFIGATSGAFFAQLFSLDIPTFAAIGLVSLLAGAANTPIAASVMAIEMFGPSIAPYASVACVISFLMTGHRSVYPSQVLQVSKSASIHVQLGGEIQDIHATYEARESTLIGLVKAGYRRLCSIFSKKD